MCWLKDSGCGKSKYSDAGSMELPSGFIVGGQDARPGEFAWQVRKDFEIYGLRL